MRTLAICAGLIVLAGVVWRPGEGAAQDSRRWDERQMFQKEFSVQPGGTLRVDVPDGNVLLESGPSDKVAVEITLAARDLDRAMEIYDSMNWSVEARDKTVSVRARSAHRHSSWWGLHHGGYEITIAVRAPQEFNIDFDTGDGNIQVGAVRGHARLETSDGDVNIESIEGASLDVDTSDGDIDVASISSPDVHIETSDGDVEINSVASPDLHIETSDGTILVGQLQGSDSALRTSDGDIVVEAASGALSATTGDGDIRVRLASFDRTSLRSGDGDIYIETPANVSAEIDLRGERISLRESSLRLDGVTLSKTRARGDLNGGGPRLTATSRGGRVVLTTAGR